MKYKLQYSAYAHALGVIFSMGLMIADFMRGYYLENTELSQIFIHISLLITIIMLPFIILGTYGFIYLGKQLQKRFLYTISIVVLVFSIGVISFSIILRFLLIFLNYSSPLLEFISSVFFSVIGGILNIGFGIALYKAKDSTLFKWTGALNVLTGLLLATILLYLVGALLSIPLGFMEAWLLYNEGVEMERKGKREEKSRKEEKKIVGRKKPVVSLYETKPAKKKRGRKKKAGAKRGRTSS